MAFAEMTLSSCRCEGRGKCAAILEVGMSLNWKDFDFLDLGKKLVIEAVSVSLQFPQETRLTSPGPQTRVGRSDLRVQR